MVDDIPAALEERFHGFRLLGRGAYGTVFFALDRSLERPVAIKLLAPYMLEREAVRERFLREARLAARIRSQRVTEVYDYGMLGERPYIVFQFVDGQTLADHREAAGGRLSSEEATRLFEQILEGLVAVHEQGVLHRDLKPRNVLLDRARDAYLADLGLARGEDSSTLTGTGQLVGTPGYMSPDQMEGRRAGPDADLYAAALVYWELLTGALPFGKDTFTAVYARKLRGLVGGLEEAGVALPPDVEGLVRTMLEPEPEARAREAATVLEELRSALARPCLPAPERTGVRSRVLTVSQSLRASSSVAPRRRGWAGAAMAATLVALGVWAAWPRGATRARSFPGASRPTPAVTSPPWGVIAGRLAELRRELEEAPEVRAALALTDRGRPGEALETWRRGRRELRRHTSRLATILGDLPVGVPPLSVADELARLSLIERLLASTRLPGIPPLHEEPGDDPGLARALARVVTVGEEPAVPARYEGAVRELNRKDMEVLGRGGARWRTLRSFASIARPPPERGHETSIKLQNHAGEAFRDPGHHLSSLAREFRNSLAPTFERSPEEAAFDLAPVEGDLELVLLVHDWDRSFHGWIDLVGRERTLHVCFTPLTSSSGLGPDARQRAAVRLRVAAGALPAGLRRARLRVVGLQPIGDPSVTVNLEEVHQLLVGSSAGPAVEARTATGAGVGAGAGSGTADDAGDDEAAGGSP